VDADYVAKCAQIASVLEVSGHPKPGNVHRTRDFSDMVFEDFLISGVVIGDHIRRAASRGHRYQHSLHKIGLGELIRESVVETDRWVENNTNLGIVMLLTPLAAAAGMSDDPESVRGNVDRIIRATTPQDAVDLYQAINIAEAGGMGEQNELDVASEDSVQELLENEVNMFQVLEMSAGWDRLSYELTQSMPVTFETGLPVFRELKAIESINQATVQTFLTILSRIPDTLIERKFGEAKAQEVSRSAKGILDEGGILTQEGRYKLDQFDEELVKKGLNPGTTADLTASSIMAAYLADYNKNKLYKDID
jgi:triphosphoribosyl-dephospho-CoA synthase